MLGYIGQDFMLLIQLVILLRSVQCVLCEIMNLKTSFYPIVLSINFLANDEEVKSVRDI